MMVGGLKVKNCPADQNPTFPPDWQPKTIRHSSFAIRHSLFVTRYSSPVIRHSLFVTRYSSLVIRHFGTIAHMAWLF